MNARPPVVSVTICLHNSSRYIDETLESVFAQTFEDFELLLVDDGSTDGCAQRIERQYVDPRIRLFRQSHTGLGGARRLSIAHARGEFIAFLDHDDVWAPEKLERQVAVARQRRADVVFSDALLIDARGREIGRMSDRYGYAAMNLAGTHAHLELLERGCFVCLSTALARASAVRAVGSVNAGYQYVEDYDLWLRLARIYAFAFVDEPLAKWRTHAEQFTRARPDVALAEEVHLLLPIARSASYPERTRRAIGDFLFGQHRQAARWLADHGDVPAAARAIAGIWRYPGRVRDFVRHRFRSVAEPGMRALLAVRDIALRARARIATGMRRVRILGPEAPASSARHIWIDGTPLEDAHTGYFNFLCELIRDLVTRPGRDVVVHVSTEPAGRAALRARLGDDAGAVHFHAGRARTPLAFRSRLARVLWRRFRAPSGAPPDPDTVELVLWRGAFRWAGSRRIAIVQDLTTRIHPELHTPGNVAEFDEFLGYVQRHAHQIATPSESTRRDVIERIGVNPESVSVFPMPLSPRFIRPVFNREFVTSHNIAGPYLLCVGTIEPRKNLRRLVRAFESIMHEPPAQSLELVLVGPDGWDDEFQRFLVESDAFHRVKRVGFVPAEHLPSLNHFAAAVVYPSLYEGFGLPVFEAMASSSVVLTSRISSLPEVLGDGGLYFDPYSTADIAAGLRRALAFSDAESAAYRAYCRARAEMLVARLETGAVLP